ncbi:MAG TPA: hypothetical protein PLX15_01240 [Candidatus Woesearchaeota archaeon]|nr:hypothetical protein [Candidatus Woesearchaeota archaeon]
MKKKYFRFLSLTFLLIGMFFLFNSKTNITGAVVGISNIPSGVSSILGIIFIIVSVILLVDKESIDNIVGFVEGYNPVTKEKSQSPLYAKITEKNIDEIFQTPLEKKFRKNIMGAKAIVYMGSDGNYHTAFLTEAINTHHRHAAATVARLVEGKLSNFSYTDEKADSLYKGDSDKSCELLTRCGGFELQYDLEQNKIVGIQQDSWLTKEQKRCGRQLSQEVEEDMILDLLSKIDKNYLCEGLKNLDDEYLYKLKADPKAA